jgi:hypothetical protein
MTHSSRIGKAGESLASGVLGRLGVHMVEEIATPFIIIKRREIGGFWWWRVKFKKKVSADHTGVLSDGRRVLAEVKTVEHNLRWGDFSTHQPERLSMNVNWNGISLVVWVHSSGVKVLRWPIPGFGKGKGITPERAEELSIETEVELHGLV